MNPMFTAMGVGLCLIGVGFCGELREERVPKEVKDRGIKGAVKIVEAIERTNYVRDGKRVGSLIVITTTIDEQKPTTRKLIQFFVNEDTWVEVDIENPARWVANGSTKFTVMAAETSVQVTSAEAGYFENYFLKPEAKFFDGPERDAIMKSFFASGVKPR